MPFQLIVTQAKEHKGSSYDDAFPPVTCPDCDGKNEDAVVFKVHGTYEGTTLLTTFVPRIALEPAILQTLQLFDVLASRIDAATEEHEKRQARGDGVADDTEAIRDEFSVKHD